MRGPGTAASRARRPSMARLGATEKGCLDLAQPDVVTADPDRGVVVEEGLGQAHDRVGQRFGVSRRPVTARGHLSA